MDKLKPIIDAVKKYHFWVICGAALLTVLVCWWLATNGLAGDFKAKASKINSAFTSVSGIQADHPNEAKIKEIKDKQGALKQSVYSAWEYLYRQQKEKNPFPTAVLGEDFQKQFENLRLPQEELARRYRERYQNYIKDYFPKLLEQIEVRHPVEPKPGEAAAPAVGGPRPDNLMGPAGGGMPMPGAANAEQEWTGVIDWNPTDYARLVSGFEWQQTPSTMAVVLAQEDLWVYEALLRVIKNTNEGATNQSNASVKRIDALEIGRDAVAAWKNSENALGLQTQGAGTGAAQGGMGPGMDGGLPGPAGAGMPGDLGPGMGHNASGGQTEEQLLQQLFQYRYIDDKGTPLAAQPQYPYVTNPYAEFKMMPIRMMLVIDQRKIPKLLAECANSNMPIEVRRVRILKEQGPANASGAGTMGPGPAMGAMGMPPGMMPGGAMPTPAAGSGNAPQETGRFDVPIEIHATIYIYNPPDREKLGTGTASAAPPAEARRAGRTTAGRARRAGWTAAGHACRATGE